MESQAPGLSRGDLQAAWSVINVLTSLKRRKSQPPTAALIHRKIDALSLNNEELTRDLVELLEP